MKNIFAIVCEWPQSNAAENETIFRFKLAAKDNNKQLIIIDKFGYILDNSLNSTNKIITNNDVDFIINLHFASPKNYDGFSYVALWNPIKFYHDWGYKEYSFNLLTHHDFISCLSDSCDDHATRIAHINNTKHLSPKAVINHTNFGPYISDSRDKKGIFYCGINWDKSSKKAKGRFHNLFKILDKENILKIYGPRKIGEIKPWSGFRSYVGDIAFDGKSLLQEAKKCLLGIALSSDAHIEDGIATSRVFELIAAGTLPICDENPFFKKYFSNKVLYVSGNQSDKARQIINHYNWAIENQHKVRNMIDNLQTLMKKKFDLSNQIKAFYANHQKRRAAVEKEYLALECKFKVNIIYVDIKEINNIDCQKILNIIKNQIYPNINLIIATKSNIKKIEILDKKNINYYILNHEYSSYNDLGLIIDKVRSCILPKKNNNDLFMITNKYENLFYDHISSLVRCFEDNKDCLISESNFNTLIDDKVVLNRRKESDFSTANILFKLFPPSFILKYLCYRNYKNSIKSFFGKNFLVNKVTGNFDCNNDLVDKKITYSKEALFLDYYCKTPSLNFDKKTIYKMLYKIKFLKPFIKIRELIRLISKRNKNE